jgi:hypothetical protein
MKTDPRQPAASRYVSRRCKPSLHSLPHISLASDRFGLLQLPSVPPIDFDVLTPLSPRSITTGTI